MSDKQQSLADYINALGDTDHRAAQEYCDLIREIRSLKEQQQCEREHSDQWIPVSERLPEEDLDVLIHGVNIDIDIDCIVAGVWLRFYSCGITHWMPLPQPPTAEDG